MRTMKYNRLSKELAVTDIEEINDHWNTDSLEYLFAIEDSSYEKKLLFKNPWENFLLPLKVFFFFKLHVANTVSSIRNMGTKHAFMKIRTILNKKRIADLSRTNDRKTITTNSRIIYSNAVITVSTSLTSK